MYTFQITSKYLNLISILKTYYEIIFVSGATPKSQGDWSVKDSLRFNELVVNKSLVSIIRSKGLDESGVFILGLELTDTSDPEEDLHIIEVLIKENRAEPIIV